MAFTKDGLNRLWNELVKEGEVSIGVKADLINGAGVLASRGMFRIQTYLNLVFGSIIKVVCSAIYKINTGCFGIFYIRKEL